MSRQVEIRYYPAEQKAYVYLTDNRSWVDKVVMVGQDRLVTADMDDAGKVIGIEFAGVERPVCRVIEDGAGIEVVRPSAKFL